MWLEDHVSFCASRVHFTGTNTLCFILMTRYLLLVFYFTLSLHFTLVCSLPWSAVCILPSVCILSPVCSLRFMLTDLKPLWAKTYLRSNCGKETRPISSPLARRSSHWVKKWSSAWHPVYPIDGTDNRWQSISIDTSRYQLIDWY